MSVQEAISQALQGLPGAYHHARSYCGRMSLCAEAMRQVIWQLPHLRQQPLAISS